MPTRRLLQLEICVETLEAARGALTAGADRLELCACLSAGGVTPCWSLIEACCQWAADRTMVMIRPRTGPFCYSAGELRQMQRDIEQVRQLGARGVVLGALTARGQIDMPAMRELLAAAESLDVTFHRAFDVTPDLSASLDALLELGVPRLLSSGGAPTAWDGRQRLRDLVQQAAGRLSIMPGSGVRPENAADLLHHTRCRELHASARGRSANTRSSQPLSESSSQPSTLTEIVASSLSADRQPACCALTVSQLRGQLDLLEPTLTPPRLRS